MYREIRFCLSSYLVHIRYGHFASGTESPAAAVGVQPPNISASIQNRGISSEPQIISAAACEPTPHCYYLDDGASVK